VERFTDLLFLAQVALLFGAPIDTAGMDYDDRERLMEETRRAIEALRVDALRVLG